jgi:hypothetical protein
VLEMTFWDVQHGNAIYVKTPNGMHIAQDLGTGSYGRKDIQFSPLCHIRNNLEVDQLDLAIITHPHKDHIDDIMNFDRLSPRAFCRPRHLSREEILENVTQEELYLFEKYFEIDQRYSRNLLPREDPFLPENNGGVNIQYFIPKSCSISNINNHSIVTVLSYANSKVILPGDNESASWRELLDRKDFRDAIRGTDIFLASHHGREAGYFHELFEHFEPKLIVISDGASCDTSATKRYSEISKGWTVYRRQGREEMRKCVTTRNDGVIVVRLRSDPYKRDPIEVTIG